MEIEGKHGKQGKFSIVLVTVIYKPMEISLVIENGPSYFGFNFQCNTPKLMFFASSQTRSPSLNGLNFD